ncbi:MAG: hypothetical protein ACPKQO_01935, partial [Nitrososphaeraceae archaeon]
LEWYNSIPEYIKEEIDNENKEENENEITVSSTMNDKIYEINCILKKIVESNNMGDKKPTIEELKSWMQTNQL